MPIKKPKILMISSSGKTGGGPIQMCILSNKLYKKFNFFIAIPEENILVNFLSENNNPQFFNISERKLKIKELIKLINYIKNNSIDLIHSHGKGAAFIGRIISLTSRTPHLYTFHGIHTLCHGKIYNFFYMIYELIFGLIDERKIFVSESERLFAINNGIYFGNNYSIINNGINLFEDKNRKKIRNLLRKKYQIDNKQKCIISVCRFVNQKNIFEMVEIAKLCKEYKFFLVGDGPLKKDLELCIAKTNLKNIFLTGIINNVFDYLCSSDLFLSTSIYEGLPISIIEAMSVGLPIVASKVTGNIDTIEDSKSGFFYELGNPLMASEKIKFLLNNEKLLNEMGLKSRLRQKKYFSATKMAKNYQDLYISCLS